MTVSSYNVCIYRQPKPLILDGVREIFHENGDLAIREKYTKGVLDEPVEYHNSRRPTKTDFNKDESLDEDDFAL